MARLVEVSLCTFCTEWAWRFRASVVRKKERKVYALERALRVLAVRYSHPHSGGLCGEWSRHLEIVCMVYRVVAAGLLDGNQALCLHSSESAPHITYLSGVLLLTFLSYCGVPDVRGKQGSCARPSSIASPLFATCQARKKLCQPEGCAQKGKIP
eukprot:1158329-Pelagomonas_calceolata.AAC.14